MEDEVKEAATGVEAAVELVPEPAKEAKQIYDLHIELAAGMTSALKAISEINPPNLLRAWSEKTPLSRRAFTGWWLATDIMKEASYGAYDTLALKRMKVRCTFLHRE
jgi:hypothetical protein